MVGIFLSCPLFRPRSCRCSRCLLFACQEELLYKHHTLDCVYMYLVWNLNQLFNGKYPRHGFNGAPLSVQGAARAGDWVCNSHRCFQVTEIRGDWAWHKMIFRFNSSWKAGSNMPVCFKCRAYGTGPTQSLYYNIEENSPCWQTEYANVADFIAEQCPPSPCPLVFLKYIHQDLIKWCSMHTLNLGLCYSTNGGALMLCDKDWFQNMLPFFCCPMYFFWFHLVYVTVFIALVLIVF